MHYWDDDNDIRCDTGPDVERKTDMDVSHHCICGADDSRHWNLTLLFGLILQYIVEISDQFHQLDNDLFSENPANQKSVFLYFPLCT